MVLAQATASSARCYMCFAVQIVESNGRACTWNIFGSHRTSGSRPSCVKVFVLHAGIRNEITSVREGFFRFLSQYWLLSHGQPLWRSIKIEFQAGELRKYSGKRKTQGQRDAQLLNDRRS